MKNLIIIPARGGSKGVPGKNIKMLHGKPLIHYTIEAAREIFSDSDIIVSTDSSEIKKEAEKTGLMIPFLRPESLATDTANTQGVILHALDFYTKINGEPDVVILLQPTSPLRTYKHIESALNLYSDDVDMVVSVKETDANPYYVLFEENKSGFLDKSKNGLFTRRQDCPKVWELNGAIYIINTKSFRETEVSNFSKIRKYEMSEEDSVDIDSMLDWMLAEVLIRRNENS